MIRWKRRGLLVLLDAVLVNLAYLGALFIRFEGFPPEHLNSYFQAMVLTTGIRLVINYFFGLYRRSWQYASIGELLAIVGAASAGTILNLVLVFFFFHYRPPRSVLLIAWLLNIAFLGGIRFAWRIYQQRAQLLSSEPNTTNV
ncbi:MAG: polysaccharide biosynthesis protein, partial [Firmicutes bacterium]|nr:polysaccharide biosynthesis protein [Bacillota bacterium]